mmetsp:Transcript_8976/g.20572  ORF Transcript_8976/g.20572 Transcript_8976/m.20572 type:complete len:311 (-) Transcript_8976:40-972(-)
MAKTNSIFSSTVVLFMIYQFNATMSFPSDQNKLLLHDLQFSKSLQNRAIEDMAKMVMEANDLISTTTKLVKRIPQLTGVGIKIRESREVVGILAGSSAEKSGNVMIGDKLLRVDGLDLPEGVPIKNVSTLMQGEPETMICLTFLRGNQEVVVNLERNKASLKMMSDDIVSSKPHPQIVSSEVLWWTGTEFNEDLVINRVPETEAEILLGDEIISVDAIRVTGLDQKHVYRLLESSVEGERKTVLLSRKSRNGGANDLILVDVSCMYELRELADLQEQSKDPGKKNTKKSNFGSLSGLISGVSRKLSTVFS